MWLLLAGLAAGAATGIITGLLPGLHPNTVIFMLLPAALDWDGPAMVFVAFTTGMSVVHTFVSFIPGIFMAAAEEDTALAARPGRRMVAAGRGEEAVRRTVYGGVVAGGLAVLLLPVFWIAVPVLYRGIVPVMPAVLAAVVGLMVWDAQDRARAAWVVLLAGLLGLVVLDAPPANTQYILLPVFGGLFGVATAVQGLDGATDVPPQDRGRPVPLPTTVRGGSLGVLGAIVAGFLPGVGTAQSAIMVDRLAGTRQGERLVALGGITTADLFLSLAALVIIGNPRSGAAVAIGQFMDDLPFHRFVMVTGMTLVAVGTGAVATVRVAELVAPVFHRAGRLLLVAVVCFLAVATGILTGWYGLLVLATATVLGLHATALGTRRSLCMAALIAPTILFYLGR